MSSGANPALSEASLPPIPPAIQALLSANVNLLVVDTVFPTLLVPIAIGLFLFSTPELRRKPIFILNVVAILLGLIFGSIAIYSQVWSIVRVYIDEHNSRSLLNRLGQHQGVLSL